MKNTHYNIKKVKKENKESEISDTLKFTEKYKEKLEESITIVKDVFCCEDLSHAYSKLLRFLQK